MCGPFPTIVVKNMGEIGDMGKERRRKMNAMLMEMAVMGLFLVC